MKCPVCLLQVPKADEQEHSLYHAGMAMLVVGLQRDVEALQAGLDTIPASVPIPDVSIVPVAAEPLDEAALRAKIAGEIALEMTGRMHPRERKVMERLIEKIQVP